MSKFTSSKSVVNGRSLTTKSHVSSKGEDNPEMEAMKKMSAADRMAALSIDRPPSKSLSESGRSAYSEKNTGGLIVKALRKFRQMITDQANAMGEPDVEKEKHIQRFRNAATNSWKKRNDVTLPEVQSTFSQYKDKYNMCIFHHITVPPDYFLSFASRNPITGAYSIKGVESEFDFSIIDLYDRPFAAGCPDELGRDQYLYKAHVLIERTWVYQELVKQLDQAREGYNSLTYVTFQQSNETIHEIKRPDVAKIALQSPMDTTRLIPSSFQILAITTFLTAFSKELFLILLMSCLSILSLWVSNILNVPVLFRVMRFVDLLPRFAFMIMALAVQHSPGSVLPLIALYVVVLIMLYDIFVNDIGVLVSRSHEMRLEIVKELGPKCWLCRNMRPSKEADKINEVDMLEGVAVEDPSDEAKAQNRKRQMMTQSASSQAKKFYVKPHEVLPKGVVGLIPDDVEDNELLMVCDVEGLLVYLTPIDAYTIEELDSYRRKVEGRPTRTREIELFKQFHVSRRGSASKSMENLDDIDDRRRKSKSATRGSTKGRSGSRRRSDSNSPVSRPSKRSTSVDSTRKRDISPGGRSTTKADDSPDGGKPSKKAGRHNQEEDSNTFATLYLSGPRSMSRSNSMAMPGESKDIRGRASSKRNSSKGMERSFSRRGSSLGNEKPTKFRPCIHSGVTLKIYNQMYPSQRYKEAMFVQSNYKSKGNSKERAASKSHSKKHY